jgi:hypothetical protein
VKHKDELGALRDAIERAQLDLAREEARVEEARVQRARVFEKLARLPSPRSGRFQAAGWTAMIAVVAICLCWAVPSGVWWLFGFDEIERAHHDHSQERDDLRHMVGSLGPPYGDVEEELSARRHAYYPASIDAADGREPYVGLQKQANGLPYEDVVSRWAHIGVAACRAGDDDLASFAVRVLHWVGREVPDPRPRWPHQVQLTGRAIEVVHTECIKHARIVIPGRQPGGMLGPAPPEVPAGGPLTF